MRKILSAIDAISIWTGKGISFIMLITVAVVCYEVTARYLFQRPTIWASEAIVYFCGFLYVLGAAWTMRENRHVKIEMFFEKLSPRGQRVMDSLTFLFFALYMVMMLWVGSRFASESLAIYETSGTPWNPPVYPIKIAFVVGVAMLLLQGSAKLIRDIYFIVKGQEL